MNLIDTHCHLTLNPDNIVEEMMNRARLQGVTKFLCVGAISADQGAKDAVRLAGNYSAIYASVGIHPHDADKFCDLEMFESLLSHPKVVAVGETGLDYFREWSDFKNQEVLFRNSIRTARAVKKPLIIHTRDATADTLRILKEENAQDVGGVVHCYGGSVETARELADINFIISFTGVLTFKNATSLAKVAATVPLENIMLETDCPYMAPVPFRGKDSEPAHVRLIAEKLAELRDISVEEVAEVTSANARRLFGILLNG
ncbi:MAG: TatD family hydrolase [bacterium]|nr:TatD family hydrolase [bacterium]